MQGWYKNWEQNGWINSSKKPVLNRDLWEILIPYFYNINYTFTKIKGHAGHEYNELVDELAKRGAQEAKNK
jgi:ribonuclease HI